MKDRSMDYPPKYGMDAPTWHGPTDFNHATAEAAQAAIVAVYGQNTPHVVVRLEIVTTTRATHRVSAAETTEDAAR